jgi:glutamate-ammonia-ligase adenylyltransferase
LSGPFRTADRYHARVKLPAPNELPAGLVERCRQIQERLADLEAELPAAFAESAPRVLIASQFVLETLLRAPEALIERLADASPITRASIELTLDLDDASEADIKARLRGRRHVELAAIAWRDIAGFADLERTLADLSNLADALIAAALEQAARLLEPRFGRPTTLLILGMGKLGGLELNFSSDVDLVLLYPDPAEGEDADAIEDYCRRLAQRLISLLDERTADGIVYRVDTRLRPFGKSGPLALSMGAFEAYLVQHGRDWERYAYVKARLITGQEHSREVFDEVLTPFVYRRYLDFGVFDALRQMKRLISEEVARRDKHDDIKLGRGGIREIEFIAQLFQIIRGGQDPALRTRKLLEALAELARLDVIERDRAESLAATYRFLRTAENRLQALEDRQTHEIPADFEQRQRWALAMGYAGWPELAETLDRHRDRVQQIFDEIGWAASDSAEADARSDSILSAWDGARLVEIRPGTLLEPLDELRKSGLHQRMDETSRQRLRAFVAELVPALDSLEHPTEALGRVMPVIRAICRRSAYLSLLLENPSALKRLLSLAEQSAMLARLVAEHPLLLDELLDPRLFDSPPSRAELESGLERQISGVDAGDTEGLLDAMRDFQRAAVFRVAVADRFGGLPLMKVSDRLTDIAELVLDLALGIARRELGARHGRPMHGVAGELRESGLIVVAYGKLGGLELGYGSDLDLVFLHDSEGKVQETTGPAVIDNQRYFVRLVQRLIHFLSVQTSSGRLYEIDTRLRPSGASGLIVASLPSFARYQRDQAWTWEHQALLRSRSVAGSHPLREAFERVRVDTLTSAVDTVSLKAEVANMRRRMRQELATGTTTLFDIKQDPGGLADIEFLIDYRVLADAARFPALVEYPDNVRQLEALEAAGLVPAETCASLKSDYLTLRARTHELALADGGKCVPASEFAALRRRIIGLWEQTFGEPSD